MHGNVWEWVEDCYVDNYNNAPKDGTAVTSGDCSRRVVRGGSWGTDSEYRRSAIRDRTAPGYRISDLGFRVSRTLTP
jgi:formylglycine-generating enzyme required for sulfatase activity